MMNYIWAFIIIVSLIFAVFTGNIPAVSSAMISGAQSAVEIVLGLLGAMCMWNGLMKIAEESRLTGKIAKLISPLIRRIMPDLKPHGEAMNAVCMNITANLLGLGNAATPLGLCAMREIKKECRLTDRANDSMIRFVVMNTSSIQLIPTTAAMLRMRHGAASPFDITPCVWVTSSAALAAGLLMSILLGALKESPGRAARRTNHA
ncbi:MAG: spore maturation protein A [Clostridia bacterium]|nr:spore maturation protein A [Clostridia bacterium]